MNQRQLDLALLVGIGVLLVVILGLALSSAPLSAAGDIDDPVARVAAARAAADEADDTVTPGALPTPEGTQAGETAEPTPSTPTTVGGAAAVEVGEDPEGEVGVDEGAGADAAPSEVTPAAGAVTLGRVGFAYTTGGEGACGVPLAAWQHLALSRDLLARYPCGTTVTLTLEDEVAGRSTVRAQVGDTMGADISGAVNIFVGEDEPALEYGVTRGTLAP